ncbi:GntR family transcriptional regulator [Actinocrinis puniceicyclus]|uniref:GntR family transcriptional regulator n=1 Tax=Actinocrinis puniceicyclus TaxID=977794 RepID=A0A8J7WPD8_9ACTN|nr:GntR family transcriptional regulator [Actinocrinis puniceicyclus]MBS2963120.1 GntR family transcriptional regulator [Actinocrinis puniceicyclus]
MNAVDSADQCAPALRPLSSLGERRNYRDQVAHALRAALVTGQLRPGELYSAPALAACFGVSATPVREAMLDLVREGLVETVSNKGFRVTAVTERQLDEYTHIRSLIEIPTVTGLARTAGAGELAALRLQAQRIVAAAKDRDLIGYIEADRAFHLGLLELAGNRHLVEVVGDLRKRARLYGLNVLAERGLLVASAQEHLELLDALLAHDEELVTAVMTRHLGHVRGLWARPQSD